ncbi:heterokaryon incompatibility protein-domain-containing protein [Cladorrhinum samala]|uniref:Heterokaryon incompatibility protein-domain-containing protein n=1 Tax=Cladorrhinum samala TaxID=585594 RepID=A0AAV9HYD5_9PEZI|nr:heterokaryon incompatibility protein-domain-containing protein [Cladorrhinum samala]
MSEKLEAAVNRLCSVCKALFDSVEPDIKEWQKFGTAFHSFDDWKLSAEQGKCHCCALLFRRHRLRVPDDESATPLEAEISVSPTTGFSINLHHGRDPRTGSANLYGEFTSPDPPVSFSTSSTTNSPETWYKIAKWLETCSSSHACCTSNQMSLIPPSDWPARILSVGGGGGAAAAGESHPGNVVKVQPYSPEAGFTGSERYLTLSHCWGPAGPPITLLKSNLPELSTVGIPLGSLPLTFRHAVEVARLLGVPYIWIDALCIVQDSAEDWTAESLKMHTVYGNGWLNLAAGWAGDCSEGFWSQRDAMSLSPLVVDLTGGDSYYHRGGGPNHRKKRQTVVFPKADQVYSERDDDQLKLFSRGWVFQEQLLARRMLTLGRREVHWDCGELRTREYGIGDAVGRGEEVVYGQERWLQGSRGSDPERTRAWEGVIEGYSYKDLTRYSDRLTAVSGLAARLGEGWDGVRYLAGLWSHRLRHWLLWQTSLPSVRPTGTGPKGVPSWSWASLQGNAYFDARRYSDGLVEVVDADVKLSAPTNIFGAVDGGTVKLKGCAVGAWIFRTCEFPDERWVYEEHDWAIGFSPPAAVGQRSLDETQVEAVISWDEQEMRCMAHSVFVYLVPFEAMFDEKTKGGLKLVGLILIPTYLKKGQFRRAGKFTIEEIRDHKPGGGRDYYLPEEVKNDEHLLEALRAHMQDSEAQAPQSERAARLETDPFGNGANDKEEAFRRYEQLDPKGYSRISTLLNSARSWSQKHFRKPGELDYLFESTDEDGWHVFEII